MKRIVPREPIGAGDYNRMVDTVHANRPALIGPGDMYSSPSTGVALPFTDPNPLRVLKVTGSPSLGRYSFIEQTDPAGDGNYVDADPGFRSVGNEIVLVPPSGVTLATNQLVVARRNPNHPERWELVSGNTSPSASIPENSASFIGVSSVLGGGAAIVNLTFPSTGRYYVYWTVTGVLTGVAGHRLIAYLANGANVATRVSRAFVVCQLESTGTILGTTSASIVISAVTGNSVSIFAYVAIQNAGTPATRGEVIGSLLGIGSPGGFIQGTASTPADVAYETRLGYLYLGPTP